MTEHALEISKPGYRLELSSDGLWADLYAKKGTLWARLSLLAALGTVGHADETLEVHPPEASRPADGSPGPVITVRRRSSVWGAARQVLECADDGLVVRAEVEGEGRLDTVVLLGGRSLMPASLGRVYSGSTSPTLFSPNPEDPREVLRPAGRRAVIGVTGDSLPGRGHWFFTPAPFFFALGTGPGPWLGLGLLEGTAELDMTEMAFAPADQGFCLELAYEGHRQLRGRFTAPPLLLLPGVTEPFAGLRAYRDRLVREAKAPRVPPKPRPRWWSRPMFCGWGAQCYLAGVRGTRPHEQCSEPNYDRFLAELAAHGLSPGTVVVDDGWQLEYGRALPHPGRWPGLAAWVRRRHDGGQHVLLWWKAWDPTGVPVEWCVTNQLGEAVAIDPSHRGAARFLQANITDILGASGLDADGLKVDFTARTPTGYGLGHAGHWGVSLLHEHLELIYSAAKAAKPDALVITQAANPGFADVGDMVRLNDILRLDEPCPESPVVTQMTYRAEVSRAACPDLLIDTDDWCAPDLAQWREYLGVKGDLGVPALYYTSHLDHTGEALQEADYASLRSVWAKAGAAAEAGP